MPPATARDFLKAAGQRPAAAEALLRAGHTLDAHYLGGYAVECALKALILHRTPDAGKADALAPDHQRGAMRRTDVLKEELRALGVGLPEAVAKRLVRFEWGTNLRYEFGRRELGETKAFRRTARMTRDWVEGVVT